MKVIDWLNIITDTDFDYYEQMSILMSNEIEKHKSFSIGLNKK